MFDDMAGGFSCWTENNSTSPEGNHLGLYKALLKDLPPASILEDDNPAYGQDLASLPPAEPIKYGHNMMHNLFSLLHSAVRAGNVYKWWETIHSFLICKDPGKPKLHLLRWLHLIDATYNLLLKFYMAKQFARHAENHDSHEDEQGGGRAGHAAINGAVKKQLLYELIRLRKLNVINSDNDAEACYDRIIESIGNMACRRQGCSRKILNLHAKVMRTVRYHLKHKYGISAASKSHSNLDHFQGSGQGAGDSPPRWGFISATMIAVFNAEADRWEVHHANGTFEFRVGISAFVDDTNMLLVLDNEACFGELLQRFQNNADLWNGLLIASGGKNSCPKSCGSIFLWGFDSDGRAFLRNRNELPIEITLFNHDTKDRDVLHLTSTDEPVKLLSTYLTQDGNSKKQALVISEKCATYAALTRNCPFNRADIMTLYHSMYLTSVGYPLPATTLSAKQLDDAESPTMNAFLPLMGYNRNMPRAVIFASIDVSHACLSDSRGGNPTDYSFL